MLRIVIFFLCLAELCICIFVISLYFNLGKYISLRNRPAYNKAIGVSDEANKRCTLEESECRDVKCPDMRNLQKDWGNVSLEDSLYVYSAYMDGDKIKVIGAAVLHLDSVFCQMWTRNSEGVLSLMSVKANIHYFSDVHQKR